MKKLGVLLLLCLMVLLIGVAPAGADLVVIGTANYLGNDYNLIYEDDLQLTWLDYTNGADSWQDQVAWASGLNSTSALTVNLDGYTADWGSTDWRLPDTINGAYTYGYDGTTTAGYNITSSEMGYLYYESLGNKGYLDTSGNLQSDYGLQNTGDFVNLQADYYWSGTEYSANTGTPWFFYFTSGYQNYDYVEYFNDHYALAVRPGQVTASAPVPEPATVLLLGAGLSGFGALRRRVRRRDGVTH